MNLDERSLEILNCLVDGWQKGGAPLTGRISYQEVFDWLDALGADQPKKLIEQLNSLSRKKHGPRPG